MRVAIAGAGNVGRSIAGELIGNGHEVLLIEREPHRAPSLATTGRCVVPLPQLLHHVVAHRGPPALLAA